MKPTEKTQLSAEKPTEKSPLKKLSCSKAIGMLMQILRSLVLATWLHEMRLSNLCQERKQSPSPSEIANMIF